LGGDFGYASVEFLELMEGGCAKNPENQRG